MKLRTVALVAVVAILAIALAIVLAPGGNDGADTPARAKVDMYASPTCGCCKEYVAYLRANDFEVRVIEMEDLSGIKANAGVPGTMQSCHTAMIEGYFVEGHVPLEAINKLLGERPDILGIALPGMPAGSPGMGGVKAGPFVVYAVADTGISEFVRV